MVEEGSAGPRRVPSSSSSVTLMSNGSRFIEGDDLKSIRSGSSRTHDRVRGHQDGLHIPPPIPVPTLKEGKTVKSVLPPVNMMPGGQIPDEDDEDVDEKANGGGGDQPPGEKEVEMIDGRPKDIFDRFSPRKKNIITAIVAYSAFIAPITASIFLPSIPQISAELHTNASVIDYTVAIFIVTIGCAPLLWSPLSGFYGRRFVYIASMPILIGSSIGVAVSPNVGALIGTRILQGFGGSCVLAVGAGSIGDIYRPTERGNAMGWYYSGVLIGPAFAPVIGGLFTEYTKSTWRSSQYFIAGCGTIALLLTIFFLPETSHPPLLHDKLREQTGKKFIIYRFNPLTSLGLFRWPNVCAISFVSSATLLAMYTLLIPLATILKTRYNINNNAMAGLLYLPSGAGNLIGARIVGPLADFIVKRGIKKRGYRRPEDRILTSIVGACIVMPLTCIGFGWCVQTGAGGLAPPLIISTINAVALMAILAPLNTYLIDSMPTRSAEVIAVNNFMRYLFSAAATAYIIPMADKLGWGVTLTLSAIIIWVSCIPLLATLRWGHIWRENANEKYHYTGTPSDCIPPERTTVIASSDEESKVGMEPDSPKSSHDEDHDGHPAHLLPVEKMGKSKKGKPTASGGLSRQGTRESNMPGVEEVLKRTVSLSGASAHGGG